MAPLVSSLILAILYIRGSFAAPTVLNERDINADLLGKFRLVEQYAAAAYCPSNNDSPGTKLTCSSGNCALVETANTTSVTEFQNSLITDVTGYVATDSTNNLVVVAFRGSASLQNYLADLNVPFTAADDICAGCQAAQGFYRSWVEARSGVLAAVKSAAAANPGYQVVATGHSLGGAIAAFAAAQLRNAGYSVALYTFGAPRIGGSKISDYITNQAGGNYRITHYNDPVPRLPPIALGFVHISPEYYIKSKNNVPVIASDISVYSGSINLGGNTGKLFLDINAHGWYFNDISACHPKGTIEV